MPEEVRNIQIDEASHTAIRAWDLLGKKLDWSALEIVVEYLSIDDVELLITQLEEIKKNGE